jgi:hypothetical protein
MYISGRLNGAKTSIWPLGFHSHFKSSIVIIKTMPFKKLGLLMFILTSATACSKDIEPIVAQCTLASFSTSPSSDQSISIGHTDYGGLSVAQPFVVSQNGTAINAKAPLRRTGTFTAGSHTLMATLESNGTNAPSSVILATSATLDPSTISTSDAVYYTFTFSTPVALTTGQIYWLKIKSSYGVNSTNFISWNAYDGKNGGYFSGTTPLGAVYELATPNTFSSSLLGLYRFALFSIGC